MTATRVTEVHTSMRAGADRIFAELSDGWAYVGWVVGASHIRDVDARWPEVGSKIHHKVGVWPLVLADETESLACEPGRRLLMRAKGWPLGEATVEIVLDERSPELTEVTIREAPTRRTRQLAGQSGAAVAAAVAQCRDAAPAGRPGGAPAGPVAGLTSRPHPASSRAHPRVRGWVRPATT